MGHLCSSHSFFFLMSCFCLCFSFQNWKRDSGTQRWRWCIWEESLQAHFIPLTNKSGKREEFLLRALCGWAWTANLDKNSPAKSLLNTPSTHHGPLECQERQVSICCLFVLRKHCKHITLCPNEPRKEVFNWMETQVQGALVTRLKRPGETCWLQD